MNYQKSVLTPKWLKIKKIFETESNGSKEYGTNFEIGGEFDILCKEFIDLLGEITQKRGFNCVVEGVKMDVWKERIWAQIIDNSGLLEDIAWKTDLEEENELEIETEDINAIF